MLSGQVISGTRSKGEKVKLKRSSSIAGKRTRLLCDRWGRGERKGSGAWDQMSGLEILILHNRG